MVQLADHRQVLAAGEQPVDGRVLGRQADAAPDRDRVRADVGAGDACGAGVGRRERGEHPYGGRLARAVGAQQTADRAARDVEVHAAQRGLGPVALGQHGRLDGM